MTAALFHLFMNPFWILFFVVTIGAITSPIWGQYVPRRKPNYWERNAGK